MEFGGAGRFSDLFAKMFFPLIVLILSRAGATPKRLLCQLFSVNCMRSASASAALSTASAQELHLVSPSHLLHCHASCYGWPPPVLLDGSRLRLMLLWTGPKVVAAFSMSQSSRSQKGNVSWCSATNEGQLLL